MREGTTQIRDLRCEKHSCQIIGTMFPGSGLLCIRRLGSEGFPHGSALLRTLVFRIFPRFEVAGMTLFLSTLTNIPQKSPPEFPAGFFALKRSRLLLLFLHIHVVADYSADDRAGGTANNGAFHAASGPANYCAGCASDDGITLRVLLDRSGAARSRSVRRAG